MNNLKITATPTPSAGGSTQLQTLEANNTQNEEVDSRRIAACLFAFEGIPTHKFEGKSAIDFVTGEAYIQNLTEVTHGAELQLHGSACQLLAHAFAGQFKGTGATNYLEVRTTHPDLGDFTVTMQRLEGDTPAVLRAKAEQKREEMLQLLTAVVNSAAGKAALATLGSSGSPAEDKAWLDAFNAINHSGYAPT